MEKGIFRAAFLGGFLYLFTPRILTGTLSGVGEITGHFWGGRIYQCTIYLEKKKKNTSCQGDEMDVLADD